MLASLAVGPVKVPIGHVAGVLLHRVGVHAGTYTVTERLVVEQLRMPRILMGAMVGAALGVAGTTMQGLFRNPMADPGIIGVSSGGAAVAVIAIAAGWTGAFSLALPAFAFAGSLGAAFLVYGVASIGGRFSMATLLLAGIAVSAFLGAIISMTLVTANNNALREILFWLAGGLDGSTWEHVRFATPFICVGALVMLALSRDLNLLMLGDTEARSLGVRVGVLRPVLLAVSALVTGTAVAFVGTIAFVGLVVPHMLRLVLGPDNRVLVPMSAVGGALFMVVADTIARTAVQPAEFRVGIMTSLVGAPFFLFLLIRNKRRAEEF
ncbi:MAG: iron chelate uptake ABC transporter family permease subunit [Chloroflexi bacterium]|nr:iron chelate uptake ABC transporter family permease subunit [Chloroflexota bacterium]